MSVPGLYAAAHAASLAVAIGAVAGGLWVMVGGVAAVVGGLVAFGWRAVKPDVAAWICGLAGIVVMALLAFCGGILGNRPANA